MTGSTRRRPAAYFLAGITIAISGCAGLADEPVDVAVPPPAAAADAVIPPPPPEQSVAAALDGLATLEIKGRAPKTGYDRALFGQRWSDDVNVDGGRNGCDTRNDILQRDLDDITFRPGTRDCVVATGTLHDPYTGSRIDFVRGERTSEAVQIDHVVALSDAWQKGAQQLDAQTRADFANDPLNLRAVDGPTNQRKGDGDAATWLPPNRAFRCTYVADQVAVKARYRLWVTQAEHDAIAGILSGCTGAELPPAPEPLPDPAPAPAEPASEVYYPHCAAARAAGVAPIHRGSPGYRPGLDGDGDGIACE
ncbi:DUF1524 domain-containing protein [Rhodococcus triatomae]|uniref:Excalibur calcium-binding domain-containing protein n=1 Tax=Rhodococcus triatomae TaxID=300028 RepID=A0A1G8GWK3_9NOCA|nr:DUF1524 domain-containing protein [Rhodococcus triatomae]QNG20278.1 DUF1524 domain-containing protein [Rhodococcus triatomae]QNG23807.1 DUF1524 domain-containing protein [Rhodococcus triatomae]SDH98772.1 Excalibur calcium-binding domain-containing protein [Rhodococcus triatomae]